MRTKPEVQLGMQGQGRTQGQVPGQGSGHRDEAWDGAREPGPRPRTKFSSQGSRNWGGHAQQSLCRGIPPRFQGCPHQIEPHNELFGCLHKYLRLHGDLGEVAR